MPYKFTQHETIYQPYKMEDQWTIYTGCSSPPINISSEGTCTYNHICACNNTYSNMSGGAVRVTGNATVTISNSVFDCNTAGSCGGAVSVTYGNVTICNSSINSNCACCHSGGVIACGSGACVTINNSCINSNTACCDAGGVGVYDSACVTINNSCINSNTACCDAGGVGVYGGACVTINNSRIDCNCSCKCGAAAVICCATGCFCCDIISCNHASNYTSGIFSHCCAKTEIINTTICCNCGQYGGGLFAEGGSCTVMCNSSFFCNCATSCGGGIYASGGCLVFCGNVCICCNQGACPGIQLNNSSACAYVYGTVYDWDGVSGSNQSCQDCGGCYCDMKSQSQVLVTGRMYEYGDSSDIGIAVANGGALVVNDSTTFDGSGVAVEGGGTFDLSARTGSEALELDTLVMDDDAVLCVSSKSRSAEPIIQVNNANLGNVKVKGLTSERPLIKHGDTIWHYKGGKLVTDEEESEPVEQVIDNEPVVEEVIPEPEPEPEPELIEETQADGPEQVEPEQEQVDEEPPTMEPEQEQVDEPEATVESEPEQVEPEPEPVSEPVSVEETVDEPDASEPEPEPEVADTSMGEEVHNEGGDTGEREASEVSTAKARVAKEPEPEPESEPVAEEEEEPDMINPSITITLGEDEPAIGVAMPITIVATDNVAITNITCTVDGKKKRAQMSTGKGTPIATSTYTFTPEEAGDYTVIATATDKAGNAIEASEVITVAEDKDTETINFNAGLE